jgi:hypothetical protein
MFQVIFVACFIPGVIMVAVGWVKVISCANRYSACVDASQRSYKMALQQEQCRQDRNKCYGAWPRCGSAVLRPCVVADFPVAARLCA